MTRTTKVARGGAIHTSNTDVYGTVTEVRADAGLDGRTDGDDEVEERVRYERVLRELTELEEVIARAEEQTALAETFDEPNTITGEEEWLI